MQLIKQLNKGNKATQYKVFVVCFTLGLLALTVLVLTGVITVQQLTK